MRNRNKVISIRVSETEYYAIKKLANEARQSMTDYIIRCSMKKRIMVIDVNSLVAEVKRIGNNLNQLTRLANMGRITAVQLSETKNGLTYIYGELQKILKRCS